MVWRKEEGVSRPKFPVEGRGLKQSPAREELRNSVGPESRTWAEDWQEISLRYKELIQRALGSHKGVRTWSSNYRILERGVT